MVAIANISLLLVGLPGVNDRPVVFVSVSQTVPSSLRNVRRNGDFCTFTCRPDVAIVVSVLTSVTVIGGRDQFLMTVKDAFVLNAVTVGSMRTRTTLASRKSSFTLAVAQTKVSSFRELLDHEVTLPGSAAAMSGSPRRTPNRSVARFIMLLKRFNRFQGKKQGQLSVVWGESESLKMGFSCHRWRLAADQAGGLRLWERICPLFHVVRMP